MCGGSKGKIGGRSKCRDQGEEKERESVVVVEVRRRVVKRDSEVLVCVGGWRERAEGQQAWFGKSIHAQILLSLL